MRIRIKQRKTNRFKKPGCWVAMGTLAAYAINPPAAARAQKPVSGGQSPQTSEHTLPVMRFDIAPAALDEVLREFERATGWKVEIPDAGMRSLPSKGVSGVLPAPQALRQILSEPASPLTSPAAIRRDCGFKGCVKALSWRTGRRPLHRVTASRCATFHRPSP